MKIVVVPVRQYIEEEQDALGKLSREYKKKSEQYDSVLNKHMKRVTESDFKEDEELALARDQVSLLTLDHFNCPNVIHSVDDGLCSAICLSLQRN